jgi:putative transferase (TIGR04331 family)
VKLIKTAIGYDLDSDEDYLFLGTWCTYNDERNWYKKLNVLPYHWDDRKKYYQSYKYLDKLYEDRLKKYSTILNEIHGATNEILYWRIIIGPWLRSFMDILYDRYQSIAIAIKSEKVDDVEIFNYNLEDWVPKDFNEYYSWIVDDPWNEVIYSEAIKYLEQPFTENKEITICKKKTKKNSKFGIKTVIRKLLYISQRYLIPPELQKISFVSPYATLKNIIKLQLKFKQLVVYASDLSIDDLGLDSEKRKRLELAGSVSGFECFLDKMLSKLFPKVYLESFDDIKTKALKYYPKRPEVICTSVGYFALDGFKIWTADSIKNYNTKYYIGQHGGNMGISFWNQQEDHQIKSSDTFFSWGWLDSNYSSIQPMPSIKLSERCVEQNDEGHILLVLTSLPKYFYNHYSTHIGGQYLTYLSQQAEFLEKLNQQVSNILKIRLDKVFDRNVKNKIPSQYYGSIDNSGKLFLDNVKNSRICICTHNGTTLLQMLSLNFPVIVFWDCKYNEIKENAMSSIDELREVGIFHETPESAAEFLNQIVNNISDWWGQEELQNKRKSFISKYAYRDDLWVNDWKKQIQIV